MASSSPNVARGLNWFPFYYGWINVVMAAGAMTATLPGRTHGLGLITEPLRTELGLSDTSFARINLIGALAGAAFAVPTGWLIDRLGVRAVLAAVTLALGLCVAAMSRVEAAGMLLVALVLVRGLGQSALSVASMAAVSKWFRGRLGAAMGVFAVLLTFGFIGSVLALGAAVEQRGWRTAWFGLGAALVGLAPCFWLLVRSTPEACGLAADAAVDCDSAEFAWHEFTWRQAIRAPAFWTVALGCSAFNLVWSGVTLFNESLLAERGIDRDVAVEIMAILTGTGLLANLACGKFATRNRVLKLLGLGLAILAVALAAFPRIESRFGAQLYAAAIGLSGGVITVVFFAAWGHLFGRRQLGRIQGIAQFATVLASSLGPVVIAEGRATAGTPAVFVTLGGLVALLAAGAWVTRLPAAPA